MEEFKVQRSAKEKKKYLDASKKRSLLILPQLRFLPKIGQKAQNSNLRPHNF